MSYKEQMKTYYTFDCVCIKETWVLANKSMMEFRNILGYSLYAEIYLEV